VNARDLLMLFAEQCEKLADAVPGDLETARRQIPTDITDYDKGFLEGYGAGHIKAYRGVADCVRTIVRDNPSALREWPRVSLGFGFIWPFGSN